MLDAEFKDSELLLRAVYPLDKRPCFWRSDGKLSSAALKDPNGLSVDRTGARTLEESILSIKTKLQGLVVLIPVLECKKVSAAVIYCPSKSNIYHSEIHGDNQDKIELSDYQAKILANIAIIQK